MATRYSGDVTIRVEWVDSRNHYRVALRWKDGEVPRSAVQYVGHPASMRRSVDAPESYDEAAAAAISFADDAGEGPGEHAATTDRGTWVGRRASEKWPPQSGSARVTRGGEVDRDAAHELDLYAENTSELYSQKKSILANIQRRHKSGTYDHAKAPKLWMYWVDAAARRYRKEYGGGPETFTKATREYLARELADRYKSGEE